MDLARALGVERGLTCVVGAGGKKTALYALARQLDRAVLTATVRIPLFDREVSAVHTVNDPVAALSERTGGWPLGLVPEREGSRYLGYEPEIVDALAAAHDGPVLVKADGARTREFKAPGQNEPQIPVGTDVVVPVASVDVVARPLSEEHVHRPDRVAELTGLERGDPVTPEAVANVLAHPDGGLKGVPRGASVVPVLNKVDDATDEAVARTIAARLFERLEGTDASTERSGGVAVPRIVLARLIEPAVIDVIDRTDASVPN